MDAKFTEMEYSVIANEMPRTAARARQLAPSLDDRQRFPEGLGSLQSVLDALRPAMVHRARSFA
jgi:hypothetical protein